MPGTKIQSLAIAFALVALATCVNAQTNERIYEDLDFRFVTPGARAVGMGKTFIGLADDATAADSNPAGMSNLLEQEFSFEFIRTQITHQRLSPSADADYHTFGDTLVTPSFLSYVVPVKNATLSFFIHSVQDYRETFGFDGREIVDGRGPTGRIGEDGAFGTIAIESQDYGMSGAYIVSPWLSVGGSLTYSVLKVAAQSRSGAPSLINGVFRPINPRNGSDTIDDDAKWSGVFGVLLKPHRTVSIGARYHPRTTFNLLTTLFGAFRYAEDTAGERILSGERHEVDYVMPTRIGAGVSWRVVPQLTLLSDWQRVNYSERITRNFLIVDFLDPAARISDGGASRGCLQPCTFSMPDVSEYHFGSEYRWYRPAFTVALRGGIFTDPDHRLTFTSGVNTENRASTPDDGYTVDLADRLFNFRFNREQQVRTGYTFGGGVAFGNRWQVDAAASFADDAKEAVVSMVLRMVK
jgi:long-subunit fatty acid transport protein